MSTYRIDLVEEDTGRVLMTYGQIPGPVVRQIMGEIGPTLVVARLATETKKKAVSILDDLRKVLDAARRR